MRRLGVAAAGLMMGLAVVAALVWRAYVSPIGGDAASPAAAVFAVREGDTLADVADRLVDRGLLARRRVFLLAARLTGRDRTLPVGRFEIPRDASARDILATLTTSRPLPVRVTLPEGLEVEVMAALLADSLGLEAVAILAAADALVRAAADTLMTADERVAFATMVGQASRPDGRLIHWCEGYIAPDTYHFADGTDEPAVARAVVQLQLDRLTAVAATVAPAAASLSRHGLLALASLVETETRRGAERPTIAAVYHNRLASGMRLEADPTVAYWLNKRGERLLYRDLAVDSPYNTYQRHGLPVGPVAAAGEQAIAAAARPDPSCEALFFVADGEGGHVFSRTLGDHQAAVARYRTIMRERRR